MIFQKPVEGSIYTDDQVNTRYRADENDVVHALLRQIELKPSQLDNIAATARNLVVKVRQQRLGKGGLDAFMHEYELSSQEGVVLMCLAEALLRIPDTETADLLIRDKLGGADWEQHLGHSESLFVNASTWALMLTGRVVGLQDYTGQSMRSVLGRLVGRLGEGVIRQSVTQGMRIMARQFVMGRSIEEALARANEEEASYYRYSYDMLGEAARTADDAQRYFEAYHRAIKAIGQAAAGAGPVHGPGISIKLSALHPRYEFSQTQRIIKELTPKLIELANHAKEFDIGITVDAEEADRLDLSLDVFERAATHKNLRDYTGLGLAVQAYQKRAVPVLDWLSELAKRRNTSLMVRLVKGAYWDTEVELAQEEGLSNYPVFTRKANTDVSYLACAKRLLSKPDCFYPQFATHNAHTLAAIMEFAGANQSFEFQRLHGMGEALYDHVIRDEGTQYACRVYAPVGSHEDLLAYLVRRLLENGANTSFVNRIVDESVPLERIIADPFERVREFEDKHHPRIPLPENIFADNEVSGRRNSLGIDLSDVKELEKLAEKMQQSLHEEVVAAPLIGGVVQNGNHIAVHNPADLREKVGYVTDANADHSDKAVRRAHRAQPSWDITSAEQRAQILESVADLYETNMPMLMALAVREAGKTIKDAVAEVREAVDFCRYYAQKCRQHFSKPISLPGPTGENNELSLHGRGVFVCISPWNFPLAIFTGQIAASLAAGNSVVAKPAEQTPLIAMQAVKLFHQAGVPGDILHLLPGSGVEVGAALVAHELTAGVAFTGSTETAHAIHRSLAEKRGPIVPLIAETGGQNAMIVDSSALPEQVVVDILASAFQSSGQRCSALRVLFVQADIAEKLLTMLSGAMAELSLGNPSWLSTDIGPVIDADAKQMLESHHQSMQDEAKIIYRCKLNKECQHGYFVPPAVYEIGSISQLEREVFGPVLHVVRFESHQLGEVIESINATGYGLTLGIHSRIDTNIEHIAANANVGNIYVNRNQIGAVVGVQPFGGEGLSGTGPKAGGPHYLFRFATERTLTTNTTAQGGNTALLSLQEEDR